ncbi:MAG: hypothetical protein RLZZ450_1202 [Pseudomonadota bacterium]|jgi:hypothetical protein
MTKTTLQTVCLSLALCAGCTLSNLTPQARFQESVYTLNDAARWGQVDIAAHNVSPKYKERFEERRQNWGESVSIAEVELLYQALAADKESAVSEISLSWTDASGVMLHKSFLTQTWANEHGSFKLVDERIKKGDPGVFYVAAPPQP